MWCPHPVLIGAFRVLRVLWYMILTPKVYHSKPSSLNTGSSDWESAQVDNPRVSGQAFRTIPSCIQLLLRFPTYTFHRPLQGCVVNFDIVTGWGFPLLNARTPPCLYERSPPHVLAHVAWQHWSQATFQHIVVFLAATGGSTGMFLAVTGSVYPIN